LAAAYWGDISPSKKPMRRVAAEEAQATFLRGLLDTPTDHRQKSAMDWIISFALHIVIVSAVVIAPLAFTQAIDLRNLQLMYLTVPTPPAAAPPPAAAAVQRVRHVIRAVQVPFTVPTLTPKRIAMVKDPPAPEINSDGVIGGIPGGEAGGVLGGIIGGTDHGFAAPPRPLEASKPKVYRVGGVVKPPQLITLVEPVYSPIARMARAEGIVEVDAIIDEHGNVVEARAVSGPALLMAAAVKAVAQWRYEPTYLDGIPVAIRMEVQVDFRLQ
jgi:periplasmic protein TonB